MTWEMDGKTQSMYWGNHLVTCEELQDWDHIETSLKTRLPERGFNILSLSYKYYVKDLLYLKSITYVNCKSYVLRKVKP